MTLTLTDGVYSCEQLLCITLVVWNYGSKDIAISSFLQFLKIQRNEQLMSCDVIREGSGMFDHEFVDSVEIGRRHMP